MSEVQPKRQNPSSSSSLTKRQKKEAPLSNALIVDEITQDDEQRHGTSDVEKDSHTIIHGGANKKQADIKPEKEVGRKAEVLVTRTKDQLRATIQVFPPVEEGAHVNEEIIKEALTKAKVVYDIDHDAIRRIVKNREYMKTIQIAMGTQPEDGQDAQIVFHYDRNRKITDRSESNLKRIDYKELNNIINVKKGDLLIEKVSATPGKCGTSVLGKTLLQVKGKDYKIRAHKGTRKSEDGLRFYAETDGHVIFRNSELKVDPIYKVEAVDAKTGNIRFVGSVLVKTIVEDGYTVEASLDIRIGGAVGAATIKAKGDITIRGGVLGAGNCNITSEDGNILCKFIQDAKVCAYNDVIVEEYCRNSEIHAGKSFIVTSANKDRGFVIGGQAFAQKNIECNNVGSEVESKTELVAGMDGKMIRQMANIRKEFNEDLTKLNTIRKALLQLQELRRKNVELDDRKQALLVQLLQSLLQMRIKNSDNLVRFKTFLSQHRIEEDAIIRVKNACYPEVSLSINGMNFKNQKRIDNVLFKIKDGKTQPLFMTG